MVLTTIQQLDAIYVDVAQFTTEVLRLRFSSFGGERVVWHLKKWFSQPQNRTDGDI